MVESEKYIILVFIFTQCTSNSSKELSSYKFINANELLLFDSKELYGTIIQFTWQYDNRILIDFFDHRLMRWGRDAWIIQLFQIGIIFVKAHKKDYILFSITKKPTEN